MPDKSSHRKSLVVTSAYGRKLISLFLRNARKVYNYRFLIHAEQLGANPVKLLLGVLFRFTLLDH